MKWQITFSTFNTEDKRYLTNYYLTKRKYIFSAEPIHGFQFDTCEEAAEELKKCMEERKNKLEQIGIETKYKHQDRYSITENCEQYINTIEVIPCP